MLGEWLGAVSKAQFDATYLRRQPIAQPSTAHAALPLLDWGVLDRVLGATAPGPDVLVVAKGQLLDVPAPRSLRELRSYLEVGVGLAMRHTERCDPRLRRIAQSFETDLGEAQVQLFVTPPGTYGFAWHYDDEDVFIAQTAGRKDYYFRQNTVCPEEVAHGAVFGRFRAETSAICTATLVAGDFLYLPSRWWHMAVCQELSLSISVGVRPRGSRLALAQS